MTNCEFGRLRFPETTHVVVNGQDIPGDLAGPLLPSCDDEGKFPCHYCHRLFCIDHAMAFMKLSGVIVCVECENDFNLDDARSMMKPS